MVKIGPRLFKTGLAVALTVILVRLTGHRYEVYGAVAAAAAVAPSASHSMRTALAQIGGNLLGGLLGAAALLLFGPHPLVIGASVVLVIWLCQQFKWQAVSASAITVTIFVMAPHNDSAQAYVLWRLVAVVIGALTGNAVNALIMRPDHWPATVATIKAAGERLDEFVLSVTGRLDAPSSITKQEILDGAAAVEKAIAEAHRLHLLLDDSTAAPLRAVAERSIKVLTSLLERTLVIHKAALTAERAPHYYRQLPEAQEALRELVECRQALYARLDGMPMPPRLVDDLLETEHRFDVPICVPTSMDEVEEMFRLHRMRTGIAYMANRLGRLHVAMESALPPVRKEQRDARSAALQLP